MPAPTMEVTSTKRNKFVILENWVMDIYGPIIEAMGLSVYCALMRFVNAKTHDCYPSVKTLIKISTTSERTVQRMLQTFHVIGLVRVTPTYGPTGVCLKNLYTILDIEEAMEIGIAGGYLHEDGSVNMPAVLELRRQLHDGKNVKPAAPQPANKGGCPGDTLPRPGDTLREGVLGTPYPAPGTPELEPLNYNQKETRTIKPTPLPPIEAKAKSSGTKAPDAEGGYSGIIPEAEEPPVIRKTVPPKGRLTETEEDFEHFWSCYPREEDKPKAKRAYLKARQGGEGYEPVSREQILTGLMVWLRSRQWTKDDGEFIPWAATWLNKRLFAAAPGLKAAFRDAGMVAPQGQSMAAAAREEYFRQQKQQERGAGAWDRS